MNQENKHAFPTPQNKNAFPFKLGPFGICESQLSQYHFSTLICHQHETGFYQIDPRQFRHDKSSDFTNLIEFFDYIDKSTLMDVYSYGILGNISPLHAVTLTIESKKHAKIPLNAKYFSWCYPSVLPKNALSLNKEKMSQWLSDPNIILLTVGGYMYFDQNNHLLQINTLIPATDGGLQFSKPRQWDNRFTSCLHKTGRFQEITLAALSKTGAKYFCWLFPSEELKNEQMERKVFTTHGGFAYLFHEPGDLTNKHLVAMDRYFEVLGGDDFNKSNKMQQQLKKEGLIKATNGRNWKLTYVQYKEKELESLKQQLLIQMKMNNDDIKQDDNDSKDDGVMYWDAYKVGNWLNDINMNELRIPFFQHNIDGKKLKRGKCDNVIKNIVDKLSKEDLAKIVLKQVHDEIHELIKDDKDEEMKLRDKIKVLEEEIAEINSSQQCVICLSNNKNILIKPCNHICCCDECIQDITRCPLCTKEIDSREKIYG